MSDLYEKLKELVGDEEVAKKVQSAIGEFMLPKSEYAKVKDNLKAKDEELEKIRLSNMDNEQRLQHELSKAQALQSEYSVKTNRLEAEKLFLGAGLSQELYGELLDKTVTDDREKTLSLVNGFVGILSKEKEFVVNKTKEELINSTKKPDTNQENPVDKQSNFKTSF
jgi:chaperonin cofactor prefoldin